MRVAHAIRNRYVEYKSALGLDTAGPAAPEATPPVAADLAHRVTPPTLAVVAREARDLKAEPVSIGELFGD
jgi:hypothetical protein